MSRRFWVAGLIVSLLTMLGGGSFVYKLIVDRNTVTTPLKPVETKPQPETPAKPVVDEKPVVPAPAAPILRNIQFVYVNSTAKNVSISGNFEGGETPVKRVMEKNRNKWTVTLKLAPGTYEYVYLVNGKTVRDPYNKKTSNGKSVITIKPLQAN